MTGIWLLWVNRSSRWFGKEWKWLLQRLGIRFLPGRWELCPSMKLGRRAKYLRRWRLVNLGWILYDVSGWWIHSLASKRNSARVDKGTVEGQQQSRTCVKNQQSINKMASLSTQEDCWEPSTRSGSFHWFQNSIPCCTTVSGTNGSLLLEVEHRGSFSLARIIVKVVDPWWRLESWESLVHSRALLILTWTKHFIISPLQQQRWLTNYSAGLTTGTKSLNLRYFVELYSLKPLKIRSCRVQ